MENDMIEGSHDGVFYDDSADNEKYRDTEAADMNTSCNVYTIKRNWSRA
jgi:hypothetical protein